MIQWSTVLAILQRAWVWFPAPLCDLQLSVTPFPGESHNLFWPLLAKGTHMVHRHSAGKQPYT